MKKYGLIQMNKWLQTIKACDFIMLHLEDDKTDSSSKLTDLHD